MTQRYDMKPWRKSANGKAYTVRIGSAWTDDKGTLRLAFDALPLADENNRVQAFLEVPRGREQAAAQPVQSFGQRNLRTELNDDIPFAPEMR